MSFRISLRSALRTVRYRSPFSPKGPRQLTLRFGKRDNPMAVGIGQKRSLAEFQSVIADCVKLERVQYTIVDDAVDDGIPTVDSLYVGLFSNCVERSGSDK